MPISLITNSSYPLNGTTTFPIGEEIRLVFDNLVSHKSATESVILVESETNNTVETDIKIVPIDGNDEEIENVFLEVQESQRCLVIVKPKSLLEENNKYDLFIRGSALEEVVRLNEELNSNTISKRTIYDTSILGAYSDQVKVYGLYEGKSATTLNLEITVSGEDSSGKYIWWFENEAKPSSNGKRSSRTSSRWRSLKRGCYIKFYGGDFVEGDIYKVKVYPKDKLESSYRIKFSTSNESLLLKPKEISESDIGLLLPEETNSAFEEGLRVVSMSPESGSINNSISTDRIVITFNKNLNPETINQNSVMLFKQPVSGFYSDASSEEKVPKEIIVENNKIILEF